MRTPLVFQMTDRVKVKARFNGIARRFEISSPTSWEELTFQIKELFDVQDFMLKYIDDENELVTLGTHEELEEALKVTHKTGLLRLVVDSPSDQQTTAPRIESFRDLLVESEEDTPVLQAQKRKLISNTTTPSELPSAFKTAKMDDGDLSETGIIGNSSFQEVENDFQCKTADKEQLPTEGNEIVNDRDEREVVDDTVESAGVLQNPSSTGPPTYERIADEATADQYIPLIELMQPVPSNPSQDASSFSGKLKKAPKKQKTKACYLQLAENISVELATMNEKLHKRLRSSLDVLKNKEHVPMEGLGDFEEDSYVFVGQQEDRNATAGAVDLENKELLSSPNEYNENQTKAEEEGEGNASPSPDVLSTSPSASGNNSNQSSVDHEKMAEVIQHVVQESVPQIVEATIKNLQQLHLGSPSPSSSPMQTCGMLFGGKVVHKGIVCASCGQAVCGIRYKCCFCKDYDLCEDCEGKEGIHDPNHFFAKLRNHVPGIGRKNGEMVPVLKKFVYKMTIKEEYKKEKKEEKRKEKDEKRERKKEKMIMKASRKDEKEKRDLKRRTKKEWRQMRHERDSATIKERMGNCLNAEFIADASIPDGTIIKTGRKFLKRWFVKNKGRKWNAKTVLQCLEGNILVATGENKVVVPFLKPDEDGELMVPFIAPSAPGQYESKWQLCHHSIPFGPLFWCQIVVEEGEVECEMLLNQETPTETEASKYPSYDSTTLVNSAFPERDTSPLRKFVEDIVPQGLMAEEPDEASGSDVYLSSTEDNAEFETIRIPLESVIVSSQAAQASELEWDTSGCGLDAELCDRAEIEELVASAVEDATSDVESVATDMSDEFMVVPVPPCFDPDAPLTADPSPVTVSVTEYKQMTESQQGAFSFTLSDQPTLKTELKSVPGTSFFIDRRSVSTDDTSMETISRTTVEEDNNVFEPLNDSNLQLLDSPVSEAGLESPLITTEESSGELSCEPTQPESPIITEPVNISEHANILEPVSTPAPEPAAHDEDQSDDNEDDNNDNDDDRTEAAVVPEVTSQPIAAQPVSSSDEPAPVALQPEPSSPVVMVPATVPTSEVTVVQRVRENSTSSDFASSVVSDVLSTAIDAAASAGRAVFTTVENFLTGVPKPEATATYKPVEGCEVSVNRPSEAEPSSNEAPALHEVIWPPGRSPSTCHECLMEMGFCDRRLNEQLLKKYNYNVAKVVTELLSVTDNEWSTRRH